MTISPVQAILPEREGTDVIDGGLLEQFGKDVDGGGSRRLFDEPGCGCSAGGFTQENERLYGYTPSVQGCSVRVGSERTDLEVGVEGERGSGRARLDRFAQLGGDGDALPDGRVRGEIILDRSHVGVV